MRTPKQSRFLLVRELLVALAMAALFAGCATSGAREPTVLYPMPDSPAEALAPQDADPTNPAEIAEGALYLLDPDRPGGPDYLGAARMCLMAAEIAHPEAERELARACYRVAARSALRSGDREMYFQAVGTWEEAASRTQRDSGELALHRAIRDRLQGVQGRRQRIPPEIARLIPPPGEDGS